MSARTTVADLLRALGGEALVAALPPDGVSPDAVVLLEADHHGVCAVTDVETAMICNTDTLGSLNEVEYGPPERASEYGLEDCPTAPCVVLS